MNKITLAMKNTIKPFLILVISFFSLLGYTQDTTISSIKTFIPSEPACVYEVGEFKGRISIPRSQQLIDRMASARSATPCASIIVDYSGFTGEAFTAFQFAVDIWAASIESSQVIRVDASFSPLGENTLGAAGATSLSTVGGVPGGLRDVFYPVALAEKLLDEDLNNEGADIVAQFNSEFDWYYGLDANPPANQSDFVTVVLHELGHGLGFFGFGSVTGLGGSVREESSSGGARLPSVYDNFIENDEGVALLTFEDPSNDLKSELTSSNLFCNSASAQAQLGNTRPQIWAPPVFNGGSSYSHWDENIFTAGNINSLMSPQIGRGEANHNPGPITLGFFKDMGWSLCEGSLSVEDFGLETVELSPNPFTSSITIKVANGLSDDYKLNLIDINGRVILSETKTILNGTLTLSNLEQLEAALYFVNITNTRSGTSITKKVIKK